jgi:hypothetical protein
MDVDEGAEQDDDADEEVVNNRCGGRSQLGMRPCSVKLKSSSYWAAVRPGPSELILSAVCQLPASKPVPRSPCCCLAVCMIVTLRWCKLR